MRKVYEHEKPFLFLSEGFFGGANSKYIEEKCMPRKKTIEIPDAINELSSAVLRKRAEEKKTQAKRAKKAAQTKRAQDALLKQAQARTLPYAKKIFSWANTLKNTRIGKELIETGDRVGQKGFCFFDGKPPGARQMWLGIDEEGLWRLGFG